MKPVVSVATTSGMRDIATINPFSAPRTAPSIRTMTASKSDCWKVAWCIRLAESTLATAICEPTERSIPPLITTIDWAAAAMARGRAPSPSDWMSNEPKVGSISAVPRIAARQTSGIPKSRRRLRKPFDVAAVQEADTAWVIPRLARRWRVRGRGRHAAAVPRQRPAPPFRRRCDPRTARSPGRRRAGFPAVPR